MRTTASAHPSTAAVRRRPVVVCVVLVALLVGACGADGGEDERSAPPTQRAAEAEGSDTTVGPGSADAARVDAGTGRQACPDSDDVDDPRSSQAADSAVDVDDEDVDGVGDPTLADLGDPRLDVVDTALDLLVVDGALAEAAATLTFEVTEATDEVAFDLVGLDVTAVLVDGEAVEAERDGPKLVVPLGDERAAGEGAEVLVCYRGEPTPVESDAIYGAPIGWVSADGGTFVLAEPEGARAWFPANEHPTDKSTFSFAVTVDEGLVALANGVLVGGPVPCTGDLEVDGDEPEPADDLPGADGACAAAAAEGEPGGDGSDDAEVGRAADDEAKGAKDAGDANAGTVTWRWSMTAPMAAYLATVLVGDYERDVHPAAGGVPVEVWYPADDGRAPRSFGVSSEVVAFLVDVLGPFPFDSAANAVLPGEPDDQFLAGVAFEAQAMSIYAPNAAVEPIVVHETAHQWFGDSVSVERWAEDLWWIEGFATYAEWLWLEDRDGREAYDDAVASAERSVDGDPGEIGHLEHDALFEALAYDGGALVFHALRDEVGDETFFEVLRTFVDRYRHGNASTDDLVEVASDVAGRDLAPFFSSWLDTPDRPPVPT